METSLPLTGERTVPGVVEENYWFRRHEAAYAALASYCADALVLEAGCGEGYGADLLARVAQRVIAVDYDEPATRHVQTRYPTVDVVQSNLAVLPIRSASVDVVANFQVIEHLWDQESFLAECFRVLRPGGLLLITTPNRLTFSPGRETPLNPYHTRELRASELSELLQNYTVEFLGGIHHGPRTKALDAAHGGSLIQAQIDVVLGHLPGQAVWPTELLAEVASISADDFDIHVDNIDTSLDLVAVARRPA
jgi:SAM-dependent methyltransferase